MKLLTEDCPLCQGSGEVLNSKVRMIGYTLAEGEQLDEHFVPCPLCERIKAQAELTRKEIIKFFELHQGASEPIEEVIPVFGGRSKRILCRRFRIEESDWEDLKKGEI